MLKKNVFYVTLILVISSCSTNLEIQNLKRKNLLLKLELQKIKKEQKLNEVFAFCFSNKNEIKLGEEIEIFVGAGISNRKKKQRVQVKDDNDKIIRTEIAKHDFNNVVIKGTKKGLNTFRTNLEYYIGTEKRTQPVMYEFTVK